MTVIFIQGDLFWIEVLDVNVTLMDAAGVYQSGVIPLEKAGNCIGFSESLENAQNNDNVQAMGGCEVRQGAGTQINIGDFVPDIRVRAKKQIGTAGNTVIGFRIMMFMRRPSR